MKYWNGSRRVMMVLGIAAGAVTIGLGFQNCGPAMKAGLQDSTLTQGQGFFGAQMSTAANVDVDGSGFICPAGTYDMLDWMTMDPDIARERYSGLWSFFAGNHIYNIKSITGQMLDVYSYDRDMIYSKYTEGIYGQSDTPWDDSQGPIILPGRNYGGADMYPGQFKEARRCATLGERLTNSNPHYGMIRDCKMDTRFYGGVGYSGFGDGIISIGSGRSYTELRRATMTLGGNLPPNLEILISRRPQNCDVNFENCTAREESYFAKRYGLVRWTAEHIENGVWKYDHIVDFNSLQEKTHPIWPVNLCPNKITNIGYRKPVTSSNGAPQSELVKIVDHSSDTYWHSMGPAPSWVEIDLQSQHRLTGVRLQPMMWPHGQAHFQVFAGPSPNPQTLVKEFVGSFNSLPLSWDFPQPVDGVRYVRIRTAQSVSWVAWTEIVVLGTKPIISEDLFRQLNQVWMDVTGRGVPTYRIESSAAYLQTQSLTQLRAGIVESDEAKQSLDYVWKQVTGSPTPPYRVASNQDYLKVNSLAMLRLGIVESQEAATAIDSLWRTRYSRPIPATCLKSMKDWLAIVPSNLNWKHLREKGWPTEPYSMNNSILQPSLVNLRKVLSGLSGCPSWSQIPGQLTKISVGTDREVWGINSAGQLYRYVGGSEVWRNYPGTFKQVAVGSKNAVWALTPSHQILRLNASGSAFDVIPGELTKISVGADGEMWGVHPNNYLFRYVGGSEVFRFYGHFKDVAVGSVLAVWAIDNNNRLFQIQGGVQGPEMKQVTGFVGQPSQIAVGVDGEMWGINSNKKLFRYLGANQWREFPGTFDKVSVGFKAAIWALWNQQIYRYNLGDGNVETKFDQIGGNLTDIAAGADGDVWGLNSIQQIYFY